MLFYIVEIVPLKEMHDFRKSITVHHFRTIFFFFWPCRAYLTIFPCAIFLEPNIGTWIILCWGGFKWCNIHAKFREYPSCVSKFARMMHGWHGDLHKPDLFRVLRKKMLKLVCHMKFFIVLHTICETSEMFLTLQKNHKYLSCNVSLWSCYKSSWFLLTFVPVKMILKLHVLVRHLHKIAKSYFVMSVCLSVRMEQLVSRWTDFHEIWYLSIFPKFVYKIQDSFKSGKKNGYFTRRSVYIYDFFLNCS
jgi:hypothetical protein